MELDSKKSNTRQKPQVDLCMEKQTWSLDTSIIN